jgi:hypothetical protein
LADFNIKTEKKQFTKNTLRAKFKSESINRYINKPSSIPKYQLLSPSIHERRNIAKPQTNKKYRNSYRIYFNPRKDMYHSKILVIWFEGVIGALNQQFFINDEGISIYLRAGTEMIRFHYFPSIFIKEVFISACK